MLEITPAWIMAAFASGWFAAVSSGAVFAYIVFRTKKEQHEQLFPRQKKPRHYGPITRDEFSAGDEDDAALPDVIAKMNQRMAVQMANSALKGEK